jgi:DNA-directed RNA polymerase beta subunit
MVGDGYNQDDSIIFNRASAERGILGCTYFTYEHVELEKNEIIAVPDE